MERRGAVVLHGPAIRIVPLADLQREIVDGVEVLVEHLEAADPDHAHDLRTRSIQTRGPARGCPAPAIFPGPQGCPMMAVARTGARPPRGAPEARQ